MKKTIQTGRGMISLATLVAIWSVSSVKSLPGLAISPILGDLDKIFPHTSHLEIQMLSSLPSLLIIPCVLLAGKLSENRNKLKILYAGLGIFFASGHALPRGEEHVAADPVQLPAGYRGRAGDPAHDGARGRLLRRTLPHPAAGYQFVHQQPHARTDHRIGGLARDGRLAPAVPGLRNSRHRAAADAAAAAHPATRKSGRPNSAFCPHTVPDRNVAAIRNDAPSGNHIPTGNAAAWPPPRPAEKRSVPASRSTARVSTHRNSTR